MALGGTYGNVAMSSCREMLPLSEELHQRPRQLLLRNHLMKKFSAIFRKNQQGLVSFTRTTLVAPFLREPH